MFSIKIFWLYICFIKIYGDEVCYKEKCESSKTYRYLFYEVNPSEGFNLRRDVYMRLAVLANKLRASKDSSLNSFVLVLPPWSHIVHWGYSKVPEFIPWSTFFDIGSLKKFAPVIELHEYFSNLKSNKYSKCIIDRVFVLQHFDNMFESGKFEEKWSIEKCQQPPKLRFFHYTNITSHKIQCLSFHGPATNLIGVFKEYKSRSVMLEHAEVTLHDMFGGSTYWKARRSMRFNVKLKNIASKFRNKYLNSSDSEDNTYIEEDWRDEKPRRSAKGGPYLAVHIRRRDFLRGRADQIPDLDSIAEQISNKLNALNIFRVFVATDAPDKEYIQLKSKISSKYQVYKYRAPKEVEQKYSAGGLAIIDQIICSYARYFIGTSDSTFSFRIYEEREILGFPSKVTFNVFCKDKNKCEKPSEWKIVY